MKTQKEILRWLKANGLSVAGLTSHDIHALVTSVNLSNLVSWSGAPPELFTAYAAIVGEMQEHTRHLAFHAIACELDWSHREMIWTMAGLRPLPTTRCQAEPRGTP